MKKMKEAPIFIISKIEHRVKYILGEYDPHFLEEAAIPNLLSFFDRKSSDVDTAKLKTSSKRKNGASSFKMFSFATMILCTNMPCPSGQVR